MELTCALVLAIVGLVEGNPSGYGVKGGAGAVAKAEANAAAFSGSGGFPKAIAPPTDATISGSYSKSAASNFASSASSAYSSAFSFSGSGVAPGVEPYENTPSDSTKCKSGSCPTGPNGSPASNGPVSGGASAISAAGVASSYGPGKTSCSNGACHKSPNCQGNNCDDSKCTSGNCGSSPALNTQYDTDDIAVNTFGSKTQSSGSGCSNGKCGSTTPVNNNDAPDTYSNSPAQPTNKPSTYLTTPKQGPPCSSPNCKDDIYDKNRPSSYNVPILGPDTPSETDSSSNCASGKCPNYPAKNPVPDVPPSNSNAAASSSCTSPNCATPNSPAVKYPLSPPSQPSFNSASASSVVNPISASHSVQQTSVPIIPLPTNKKSLPYTGGFGGPPGILKPNDFIVPAKTLSSYKPTVPTYAQQPKSPTESYQPSPCTSGSCESQPIHIPQHGTGENYKPPAPGPYYNPSTCSSGICGKYPSQSSQTGHSATATSYNPTQASGFSEASGVQKPNEFNGPYKGPTSHPAESYNPTSASCSGGLCASQPKPPQYNPVPVYKPTAQASGFVGEPAVIKPNYNTPSSEPYSKPPGSYKPITAPCSSGNCGIQLEPSSPEYNPSTAYKPTTPGFGGPSGILKPNDINVPSIVPTYNPTTASCSTGSCGSQPGQLSPLQYNPSQAYNPTAPGFGGPSGTLNPNDHNAPSHVPTSSPQRPHNPSVAPCSTGSCGSQPGQPSTPQYNPSPAYKPTAPGFGGPIGILKPNDHNSPSNEPTYNPSTAPCSSGSCNSQPGQSSPQYDPSPAYKPTAPGFGGPIGILKPNDHNSPSNEPTYNPSTAPCSSGSCNSQPGQSSPQYDPSPAYKPTASGFGGPIGILKPNDHNSPSNEPSYNPSTAPCSSGSCGSQPGQSLPQYNPSPAYKPLTPGFGGPSGILKPNDDNAPSNVPTYNPSTAPCSSGSCGSQPGQSLPQYNPSNAYKPTAPGFGGPSGILKPSYNNAPSNVPTSYPSGPNNPTISTCSSGICGSQPVKISPQNNPLPTYKPTAPVFGGPSGFLKPNDYNAPFNVPTPYNPTIAPCSSGNCGSPTAQLLPQYNPAPANKPIAPVPGFGGPNGLLKPNDHSTPSQEPISNPTGPYTHSKVPCSTGICGSQASQSLPQYNPTAPYTPIAPTPGFSGPGGVLKPNYYSAPSNVPSSNFNTPCSTGSCEPQNLRPAQPSHQNNEFSAPTATSTGSVASAGSLRPNHYSSAPSNLPSSYNSAPCSSGNCDHSASGPITVTSGSASSYQQIPCGSGKCGAPPNYNTQNTGAYAGAVASAKAVAYTGGFGGPPGLLKPYDGKDGSFAKAFGGVASGQDSSRGYHGKSLEGANPSGSGAQAKAIAGATAGAGANSGSQDDKNSGGCSGGCGGGSEGSGAVAGAAGKSVATAAAGAYGSSFATSSASAHASAGAATKGGYGR